MLLESYPPSRKLAWRARERGHRSEQTLVSTYFDTTKHKLKRNGLTLRVRQAGDKYVQTVKAGTSGALARGEWETELDGATPDLAKTKKTPLEKLITKKLHRKLKAVFRTTVRRMAQPIRTGRSQIELAVDRGRIASGRRSTSISEFELELKSGSSAELFRAARSFERKTTPSLTSDQSLKEVINSPEAAAKLADMPSPSTSTENCPSAKHSQ